MTECTQTEWRDIGHGVSIQLRSVDGELNGVAYKHTCGEVRGAEDYVPVKPAWGNGWDVVQLDPLTLAPSLLCTSCGHHGFIRDGKWVPA